MIRPAIPSDAAALGEVYALAWKYGYRDILPDFFLELLTAERCVPKPDHIAPKRRLVAETGKVVGTATFDLHQNGVGEIQSVYVLPAHWKQGQGSALFLRAVCVLREQGAKEITLWVLRDHTAARAFFEHMGMCPTGETRDTEIAGALFQEVQYRL